MIDGVTFTVTWDTHPTVTQPTTWQASEDGLRIVGVAGGARFSATVTAVGPPGTVAQFQVGVIQTVYASTRTFSYNDAARTTATDIVQPVPAWDGDDDVPWYSAPEPFEDGEAEVFFNDAPICPAGEGGQALGTFVDPQQPGSGPTLHRITGTDSFEAWIAVVRAGVIHGISPGFSWWINWSASVNPVARTAQSTEGGGTNMGAGPGNTNTPELQNGPANELTHVVFGTW